MHSALHTCFFPSDSSHLLVCAYASTVCYELYEPATSKHLYYLFSYIRKVFPIMNLLLCNRVIIYFSLIKHFRSLCLRKPLGEGLVA